MQENAAAKAKYTMRMLKTFWFLMALAAVIGLAYLAPGVPTTIARCVAMSSMANRLLLLA